MVCYFKWVDIAEAYNYSSKPEWFLDKDGHIVDWLHIYFKLFE